MDSLLSLTDSASLFFLQPFMCLQRHRVCRLFLNYTLSTTELHIFFRSKKRGMMAFGRKPTHHHTSDCSFGNVLKSISRSNMSIDSIQCDSCTPAVPSKLPLKSISILFRFHWRASVSRSGAPPRQHILFVPKTDFGAVYLYCGDQICQIGKRSHIYNLVA